MTTLSPRRTGLIFLLLTSVGFADAPDARTRLEQIRSEVASAQAAFEAARARLPNPAAEDPAVNKLWEAYEAKREAGLDAAVAIAREQGATDVGFEATDWVLGDVQAMYWPQGRAALEVAARYHAENPRIGKAVAGVGYFTRAPQLPGHAAAAALLQAVAENNPDRTARAQAAMGLAFHK